jgi:hypothetical protein
MIACNVEGVFLLCLSVETENSVKNRWQNALDASVDLA